MLKFKVATIIIFLVNQYSCSTCDVINGPSNSFNNMYCVLLVRYDTTGSHPPIEDGDEKEAFYLRLPYNSISFYPKIQ